MQKERIVGYEGVCIDHVTMMVELLMLDDAGGRYL